MAKQLYKIVYENGMMLVVFDEKKPSGWLMKKMRAAGLEHSEDHRKVWRGVVGIVDQKAIKAVLAEWNKRTTRHVDYTKHSNTLCWRCDRAYGQCDWSRYFRPVDGWVACEVCRVRRFNGKVQELRSYEVSECPLFEPDHRFDFEKK